MATYPTVCVGMTPAFVVGEDVVEFDALTEAGVAITEPAGNPGDGTYDTIAAETDRAKYRVYDGSLAQEHPQASDALGGCLFYMNGKKRAPNPLGLSQAAAVALWASLSITPNIVLQPNNSVQVGEVFAQKDIAARSVPAFTLVPDSFVPQLYVASEEDVDVPFNIVAARFSLPIRHMGIDRKAFIAEIAINQNFNTAAAAIDAEIDPAERIVIDFGNALRSYQLYDPMRVVEAALNFNFTALWAKMEDDEALPTRRVIDVSSSIRQVAEMREWERIVNQNMLALWDALS